MTQPAPVHYEIRVATDIERTFRLFTDRIGDWWPVQDFGVFNDGTVAFEGSELVERSGDRRDVWAEVTEWDPPNGLALNWHAGTDPTHATDLRIAFLAVESGTLVTVDHSGFGRRTDAATVAEQYRQGWPIVLAALPGLAERVA